MPRRPKKSKYKSVVINKKRYYYYKITWIDPTGDSGHATHHDSYGLIPSTMITHAYVFDKNRKYICSTKSRGWISRETPGTQIYIQRVVSCHQQW
jgi:hypothetical protein